MKKEDINIQNPTKQELDFANKVIECLDNSTCNYLSIKQQKDILVASGYEQLYESQTWDLEPGKKYFVTRNQSAIVAFNLPKTKKATGFMIVNSHSDYPTLKIKKEPEDNAGFCKVLNVEQYGGLIYHTWIDEPLSVSGRLYVKSRSGVEPVIFDVDEDLLLIPSVSVHQHRDVNEGFNINAQIDLRPVLGNNNSKGIVEIAAKSAGVKASDVIDYDMFCYIRKKGKIWGANKEYMSSQGIDDQICCYTSLFGLLDAKPTNSIPVHVVFDNEEVGSGTRQGACSLFLQETLQRISHLYWKNPEKYFKMLSNSMTICADNAHALHPNHPEKTDPTYAAIMGQGACIKYSAKYNYQTDAAGGSIAHFIADKHNIKNQMFQNRSDITSGSALGRFLMQNVSIVSADVAIAQIAMHSAYETCAVSDVHDLKKFCTAFYNTELTMKQDGKYLIK